MPNRRVLGEPRGDEVLSDAQPQEDAFAGAILGDELHLGGLCAFATERSRIGLPATLTVAGGVGREPGERPQHFDRAGADLAGKTDHHAALGDRG